MNLQLYAFMESYKAVEAILEQLRLFLTHAKKGGFENNAENHF